MIRIINGTGKPSIEVIDNADVSTVINLPFCKKLTEATKILDTLQEMIDYSLEPDEIGYRYGAILDYSQLMYGSDYLLLQPLLSIGKKLVWLTPRVDVPGRKFKVWLTAKGDVYRRMNAGHGGIVLTFTGLDVLEADPLVDITLLDMSEVIESDERLLADFGDGTLPSLT